MSTTAAPTDSKTETLPVFHQQRDYFPIPEHLVGGEKSDFVRLAEEIDKHLRDTSFIGGYRSITISDDVSPRVVEALSKLCDDLNGFPVEYDRPTGEFKFYWVSSRGFPAV